MDDLWRSVLLWVPFPTPFFMVQLARVQRAWRDLIFHDTLLWSHLFPGLGPIEDASIMCHWLGQQLWLLSLSGQIFHFSLTQPFDHLDSFATASLFHSTSCQLPSQVEMKLEYLEMPHFPQIPGFLQITAPDQTKFVLSLVHLLRMYHSNPLDFKSPFEVNSHLWVSHCGQQVLVRFACVRLTLSWTEWRHISFLTVHLDLGPHRPLTRFSLISSKKTSSSKGSALPIPPAWRSLSEWPLPPSHFSFFPDHSSRSGEVVVDLFCPGSLPRVSINPSFTLVSRQHPLTGTSCAHHVSFSSYDSASIPPIAPVNESPSSSHHIHLPRAEGMVHHSIFLLSLPHPSIPPLCLIALVGSDDKSCCLQLRLGGRGIITQTSSCLDFDLTDLIIPLWVTYRKLLVLLYRPRDSMRFLGFWLVDLRIAFFNLCCGSLRHGRYPE